MNAAIVASESRLAGPIFAPPCFITRFNEITTADTPRVGGKTASLGEKDDAHMIAVCRDNGRKIGICGQAPSDYPDFAQFLVEQKIDSISLNPDSVLKTTLAVFEQERRANTR